ncbi:hypothetical protein ABT389_26525 [Streptomyces bacillaris]|uniref:hypothetical protein n=1 Tax=Streptomyces bacillaris TaxID=68179 RepID=UPI0011345283|nr:hypothetical protein EQG64_22405 [Streptomyces sp. S6]
MTRLTVQRADGLREALLLLAAADMARARLADPQLGPGVLHHRLILDLTDMVKAQARHRACHISYEAACTLSLGERQALSSSATPLTGRTN